MWPLKNTNTMEIGKRKIKFNGKLCSDCPPNHLVHTEKNKLYEQRRCRQQQQQQQQREPKLPYRTRSSTA